jgi:hypothetical protein
VPLTKWNEPIQALLLDRTDKSLGVCVCVAIVRTKWRLNHSHPGLFQKSRDGHAPFPIAVAQEHAQSVAPAVSRNRPLPHDLDHEGFVQMRRGPDDLHSP